MDRSQRIVQSDVFHIGINTITTTATDSCNPWEQEVALVFQGNIGEGATFWLNSSLSLRPKVATYQYPRYCVDNPTIRGGF